MIDTSRIAELEEEIGDGVEEVLSLFLEEAEDVVGRLEKAEDGRQRTELLHFLRSGALNLGFRGLAGISARVEACDDAARPWPAVIAELRGALMASRAALGTPA
jgi:HPt (histidine-containing phosphotransfer) domain-containing protein